MGFGFQAIVFHLVLGEQLRNQNHKQEGSICPGIQTPESQSKQAPESTFFF